MASPPQDRPVPLTPAELDTLLRLLERVVADRAVLAGATAEQRMAVHQLADLMANPNPQQRRRLRKAREAQLNQLRRAGDQALRGTTGIQLGRKAAVFETPLPPLPPAGADCTGWWPPALPSEGAPTPPAAQAPDPATAGPALSEPRKCYICKAPFSRLHRFYDQLCHPCGDENLARRTATVDLRGRVALVTGARVKIGYQAAILLLRAGCQVVACTRFPRDAAARYAREPDFQAWQDRLSIYGIDLRHTPSVELLCRELEATLPRLDFQLHNACQTVRRPPGFYTHLVDAEHGPAEAVPEAQRPLLAGWEALRAAHGGTRAAHGVTRPALLTQAASEADLLLGDHGSVELFPRGVLDQDLQQLDLRAHNSWRLPLHEVPTLELLEVLLVNATAPFVMTARLKALMLRSAAPPPGTATSHDGARHVVLVSAMEGQFYRKHKTDKHPHTNMAKAALNMLVRTSAPDYAADGIHLNAVDTGWVTDEDPAHLAAAKVEAHAFSPPLDVVDGAARIVDPIFDGFRTGRHRAGLFFKDYRPVPW